MQGSLQTAWVSVLVSLGGRYLGSLLCEVEMVLTPGLLCKGKLEDLTSRIHLLKPPPASCVLLQKLLNFSEPPFPLCEMGMGIAFSHGQCEGQVHSHM